MPNDTRAELLPVEQTKPWPFYGYAPGNYTSRCLTCVELFEGDKRAIRCIQCAVIAAKNDTRAAAPAPVADGREVPREPTEAMVEALAVAIRELANLRRAGRGSTETVAVIAGGRAALAAFAALPTKDQTDD